VQLSLHLKSMARFMAGKYVQVGVEEGGGSCLAPTNWPARPGSSERVSPVRKHRDSQLGQVARNGKTSHIAASEQPSQEAAGVQPGQVKA
jgi:hypothetical protein